MAITLDRYSILFLKWHLGRWLACCFLLVVASCGNEEKTQEIGRSGQDPTVLISAPEGRFILKEALTNLDYWGDSTAQVMIPFTELVFDISRDGVEAIQEDLGREEYKLVRLGNGKYRLNADWELRYNHQSMTWLLIPVGEGGTDGALHLEGYTLPDTAKMSGVSAFKFLTQEKLIAGSYYIVGKDQKPDSLHPIAFTADGHLVGVSGFSRFNLLLNGPGSNSKLIPIQLFNKADRLAFFGCIKPEQDGVTIYRLSSSKPGEKQMPTEVYARLKRISPDLSQ